MMEAQVEDLTLKFDCLEVDVHLAKQYLINNECDIRDLKLPQIDDDGQNLMEIVESYKKLIKKIKENSKLICQLEYLENNTPVEVSEKNIQLILQYLSLEHPKYKLTYPSGYRLKLFKNDPLACLVFANGFNVETCEERKAVSHLFVKLCRESGFDRGIMLSVRDLNIDDQNNCRLLSTGVISERSDLDSAVDAFLASSSSSVCFWRLQRIYVQESVIESFKELLDFKTTLKGTKGTENVELKKLCSDLFVYEDKYILIDYAGDLRASQLEGIHAIFVEAYRTNKELISLVGQQVGCLSLWSSDVAEANELAYNIPASLVWINDYGNFDGPPEISTILLSLTDYYNIIKLPERFCNLYNAWKAYSKDKRLSIIHDVLKREIDVILKAVKNEDDEIKEEAKAVLELREKLAKIKFNSVEVADNKICVTLDNPIGIHWETNSDVEMIIYSLVMGNGIIGRNFSTFPLYNELLLAEVPFIFCHHLINFNNGDLNWKQTKVLLKRYRNKVILTNFGTIFAN